MFLRSILTVDYRMARRIFLLILLMVAACKQVGSEKPEKGLY